ncbi:MAG: MFS transporter [Sneathiellaceae bacterium]
MQPDGLPVPRRYLAMLAMAMALTMAVLDASIANIALPTIAREFGTSPAETIWVVNAYQLVIVIALLPLASLGEIVGYRRIYLVGLAVFTVGAGLCALSDSLTWLIAARTLQGIGAAGVMSVNTALVRFIYPSRMFGRALGLNSMVVAVSAAAGPTVAAAILSVAHWPWLFAIHVPLGLATLQVARAMPVSPQGNHRFDLVSAALSALTFGLLIIAIQGLSHDAALHWVLGQFAGAALAGWLLVRRQLSQPAPLLPVDLLRIPLLALSVATSVCTFTGQMLAYVSLPFYLQDVLGRSPVQAGLLLTPWPLATAFTSVIAGRLADRWPAGIVTSIGLACMTGGLLLLATMPMAPQDADIVWRMAICGIGFGLFQSPNNRTMIGSTPVSRAGAASGMLGTARLLGQSTGAAMAALAFGLFLQPGTAALVMAAGFSAFAALVSVLRLLPAIAAGAARQDE